MKFLIWANLKMNKSSFEIEEYLNELIKYYHTTKEKELLITPVSVELCIAKDIIWDSEISLWAQNMHYEEHGAYTWEISPTMLADFNCKYVILGHSERREYFWENNNIINKKVLSAISHNIRPILCIWENSEQKKMWLTQEVLKIQIIEWLWWVDDFSQVDIAYEPIWAIWTGETANSEYVKEVHNFIKTIVWDNWKTRIMYGGSVNPKNASELSQIENVNWFLIWWACLDAGSLMKIVENIKK